MIAPNIWVVSLVQGNDLDRSVNALETVESPRILLLNGPRNSSKERRLRAICDRLLTPGGNVGIARGRNLLFREAISLGANIVISLDDDVYVPTDYVTRMSETLLEVKDRDASTALIGPAVASGRSFPPHQSEDAKAIRERMRLSAPLVPADVDHAGISQWRHHYLRAHGLRAADARAILFNEVLSPAELDGSGRSDPRMRAALLEDDAEPVSTDVIGGGTWVLHKGVLENLGPIDERLGGFGYEDTEYCIRARLQGLTNYLIPSMPIVHDPTGRGVGRPLNQTLWRRNRFRGLIAIDVLGQELASLLLAESVALVPFEVVDRGLGDSDRDTALISAYRGLVHGLELGSGSPRNDLKIQRRGASVELRHNRESIRVTVMWNGGSLHIAIDGNEIVVETQHPSLIGLLGG